MLCCELHHCRNKKDRHPENHGSVVVPAAWRLQGWGIEYFERLFLMLSGAP